MVPDLVCVKFKGYTLPRRVGVTCIHYYIYLTGGPFGHPRKSCLKIRVRILVPKLKIGKHSESLPEVGSLDSLWPLLSWRFHVFG